MERSLFFTFIDFLIPLVIHSLANTFLCCLDTGLKGACLLITCLIYCKTWRIACQYCFIFTSWTLLVSFAIVHSENVFLKKVNNHEYSAHQAFLLQLLPY